MLRQVYQPSAFIKHTTVLASMILLLQECQNFLLFSGINKYAGKIPQSMVLVIVFYSGQTMQVEFCKLSCCMDQSVYSR